MDITRNGQTVSFETNAQGDLVQTTDYLFRVGGAMPLKDFLLDDRIIRAANLPLARQAVREYAVAGTPVPTDVERAQSLRDDAIMFRAQEMAAAAGHKSWDALPSMARDEYISRAQTETTDEPRYPIGTPEYDQYAADLRAELGKFAAQEPPYDPASVAAAHLADTVTDLLKLIGNMTFGPDDNVAPTREALAAYRKAQAAEQV